MDADALKNHLKSQVASSGLPQAMSQLMQQKPDNISVGDYCRLLSDMMAEQLREAAFEGHEVEPEGDIGAKFSSLIQTILCEVRQSFMTSSLQMLSALGQAVAMRDTGNSLHNSRVTLYAIRLGEAMTLTTNQMQALIKGSFLHDIGKIRIPDSILLKRSDLTDDQRREMYNHPLYGAGIISDVKWLEDAVDVVLHHHEKYDGSGYPAGLVRNDIPLLARIFAVVDVFDALTSKRPYKEAQPVGVAIGYMASQTGMHFDPEVFSRFVPLAERIYNRYHRMTEESLQTHMLVELTRYFEVDPSSERFRSRYSEL